MIRINPAIELISATILVMVAFCNIWVFNRNVANLPDRDTNELLMGEVRYYPVRQKLKSIGYGKGPVGFITNRDLKGEAPTPEDAKRWAQGQYVMVPWVLVRNQMAVSRVAVEAPRFIIGDFWDAAPVEMPRDLIKLDDFGNGLILLERRPAP